MLGTIKIDKGKAS